MLLELRIRNLAVIRDLSLTLTPGLNVLTGETGAGKSIVVGALGLLLGARASAEAVRDGEDRAFVEGVFDLQGREDLADVLDGAGHPLEEGRHLLLRREVRAEGGSRAWVNGSPVTVGTLGELGRRLVDFHGQHEHQTLLASAEQRAILDDYAGAGTLAAEVARRFEAVTDLRRELAARRARRDEIRGRADFLRFQLEEIDAVAPRPDEDLRTSEALARLEHAEELAMGSARAHGILYSAEGAVSEALAEVRDLLVRLARFDPELSPFREQAEELYHRAAELGRSLERHAAAVEVAPERTEELRKRRDLLFRIKRKYGPELSDVLETRGRIAQELEELDEGEHGDRDVAARLARAEAAWRSAVEELSDLRRRGAVRIAEAVAEVFPELGMPGGRFEVTLEPLADPGAGGGEVVHFLASLNEGFEPRPLARIASGGELSRVMLALKSILAKEDRIPTLVFDEIDAGIGGAIGAAVGRKLRDVAVRHQVLAITHLPQIAALGAHHIRVEKGSGSGAAETHALRLDGQERVREIARMLGGDPESATSREHAAELLTAG